MSVKKFSRQRESIRAYLRSTKEHPTADMIYHVVKQQYPSISLGTVYRNLAQLEEDGEIMKVYCGEGTERFDARTDPHYHLICRQCGRVVDLEIPPLNHIDVLAASGFKGEVDGHYVWFWGLCPLCLEKKNNS